MSGIQYPRQHWLVCAQLAGERWSVRWRKYRKVRAIVPPIAAHAAFVDWAIPLQVAARRERSKYDFMAARFERITAKKAGFEVYLMGKGQRG